MRKYEEARNDFKDSKTEPDIALSLKNLLDLAENHSSIFTDRIVDASQIKKAGKLDAKKLLPNDLEIVDSLNEQTCLTKDTKLVIAGAITTFKGMEHGYFYTSSVNNPVYKTLDKYFDLKNPADSLEAQKTLLKSASDEKKPEIIAKIKEILTKKNIAFIDVIKTAVRKTGKSDDNLIVLFDLDYEAFEKCKNVEKYICTSKNTADCLKEIFKKNGTAKYSGKISICHQDRFHYKYEEWKKALDEVIKKKK